MSGKPEQEVCVNCGKDYGEHFDEYCSSDPWCESVYKRATKEDKQPIKPEQLFQVTTGYFCCGLVVQGDRVIEAAPIMRWAVNRTLVSIRGWVHAKNGSMAEVKRRLAGE